MGQGVIEDVFKRRRRGLTSPWLSDSFLAGLSYGAVRRLDHDASPLNNSQSDRTPDDAAGHQLAGEAGAPVIIVLDGAVKVFHPRWDGPNVLVNVAGPGDVLNAEESITSTETITRLTWASRAQLITIPRRRFRDALAHNDEIQRVLLRVFAQRAQALTIQRGHAGRTVEQRLWAFLVSLGRRHGTPTDDGHTLLRVGLTQADLAAAVGASNNSMEAAIQKLRKAGKVTTGYTRIILHELPTEEELDKSFWNWNN